MDYVKLKRAKNDNYEIDTYNNEELYLLATLLLDAKASAVAKELIAETSRWPSEWPINQINRAYFSKEAKSGAFAFTKHASDLLDIQLVQDSKNA